MFPEMFSLPEELNLNCISDKVFPHHKYINYTDHFRILLANVYMNKVYKQIMNTSTFECCISKFSNK